MIGLMEHWRQKTFPVQVQPSQAAFAVFILAEILLPASSPSGDHLSPPLRTRKSAREGDFGPCQQRLFEIFSQRNSS